MTRLASRGKSRICAIRMARGAGCIRVRANQRKLCRVVTEYRSGPGGRSVTGRALPRKAGLCMVRICCPIVVGEMTRLAG
jgi:hypothetical protein